MYLTQRQRDSVLDLVDDIMRNDSFIKQEEYYIKHIDEPCPNHFIELTGVDILTSDLVFGCVVCGYRERWQAMDN